MCDTTMFGCLRTTSSASPDKLSSSRKPDWAADEFITQRVKEALALVDIRLLDHIIVGDGACVSLAERGLV